MNDEMAFIVAIIFILGSFRLLRPLVHAIADILRTRFANDKTLPARDEQIDALHEVIETLQDQVSRLSERVEFTERLLEKPRETPTEEPTLKG